MRPAGLHADPLCRRSGVCPVTGQGITLAVDVVPVVATDVLADAALQRTGLRPL